MNPDPQALAAAFLYALRQREMRQDDAAALQRFGETYRQLTQFAHLAERPAQDRLLQELTQGLSHEQSSWEFGCLANTCGLIVEAGGDPAVALAPILDRLTQQLARVAEFVHVMQEHLGVKHPNEVAEQDWPALGEAHPDHAWVIGEWLALRFMGCAAMAMLCREVALRQHARQRIDLVQRAEAARSDNPFAYYLAELLGMVDDKRLLVLDLERQLGFQVRLTAIRNNFHLFTLLQDALLAHPTAQDWRGPHVRPLLISVAKSERMVQDISPNEWTAEEAGPDERVSDAALWSYYSWLALKPDGSPRTLNASKGEPPAWVWGEMKPTEILALEGERIVLLGPLECPRSWDIGFFAPLHSSLRSSVVIEAMLSAAQFRAWISKIEGAAR